MASLVAPHPKVDRGLLAAEALIAGVHFLRRGGPVYGWWAELRPLTAAERERVRAVLRVAKGAVAPEPEAP